MCHRRINTASTCSYALLFEEVPQLGSAYLNNPLIKGKNTHTPARSARGTFDPALREKITSNYLSIKNSNENSEEDEEDELVTSDLTRKFVLYSSQNTSRKKKSAS